MCPVHPFSKSTAISHDQIIYGLEIGLLLTECRTGRLNVHSHSLNGLAGSARRAGAGVLGCDGMQHRLHFTVGGYNGSRCRCPP